MTKLVFPNKFIWGAATAAYQIEGGAQADGKGESIWDRFSHLPGKTLKGDTGDVACDHYYRYPQDIKLMKELGLNSYRFSVAWSRIFPEGKGKPNPKGLDFYQRLIDQLLANNISPAVTLYHWDLPQALQDRGGWGNRETVDYFTEYAATLFELYGDRVKTWITHNEPWVVAYAGHFQGRHAPGRTSLALAVQVTHHLLVSHAKAVQAYRNSPNHDGRIGITLNLYPVVAATTAESDQKAARLADDYHNRWFLDPVFKGEYPSDLWRLFEAELQAPVILSGDMELLAANTMDFLGVNYYFRKVVRQAQDHAFPQFVEAKPVGAEYTETNWEVYPQGLTDLLIRLSEDYSHPHILITENGAAFKDQQFAQGIVADDDRCDFLKQHLTALHRAIDAGVKVDGYYVWSLMDNYEWALGYSKRFGIIYTDYQTQKRIWKKSALWYREVINNNGFEIPV